MKRIIIPAIALLLGLTSCNWLERNPKATLAPENYFRDETDLQLFSNSFYNNLLPKEPFDEQSDHYVYLKLSAVLRGGTNRTVPNSGGGWGNGSGAWGDLRKMNTLLEYIDKCEDKDAVVKYTAVTRFFRAYLYFNMVKRFGDVPWIDAQLETDSDELYKARDSREVIMGHMIEDIDYAIQNLPAAVSPYRVNRWSALALKARFCLFEGTFRKYHDPDGQSVPGCTVRDFYEQSELLHRTQQTHKGARLHGRRTFESKFSQRCRLFSAQGDGSDVRVRRCPVPRPLSRVSPARVGKKGIQAAGRGRRYGAARGGQGRLFRALLLHEFRERI